MGDNNNHIKISVVIPCYNAEAFIKDAVESVLNQSVKPYEIIIINDGSTDNTVKILESYKDNIKIINQENKGDCSARNRGMEEAKGDWIAFLDADDLWVPEKLRKQIDIIKGHINEIVCVHSGFYLLFENGKVNPDRRCEESSGIQNNTIEEFILYPQVNTSTAVIKKMDDIRFPEGYTQGGDMLFFARLSLAGKFYFISDPLAYYRQHSNQITKNPDAWVVHFKNRFKWIEENRELLGEHRVALLKQQLKNQIIYWLQLARWNRQWERYFILRRYALTFDWGDSLPKELKRVIFPRFFYRLKDVFDKVTRKTKRNK